VVGGKRRLSPAAQGHRDRLRDITAGQSRALTDRLRSLLKREQTDLMRLLGLPRKTRVALPSLIELWERMDETDGAVRELLRGVLVQTSTATLDEIRELYSGAEHLDTGPVMTAIEGHVPAAASYLRYGLPGSAEGVRQAFEHIASGEWDSRQVQEFLDRYYGSGYLRAEGVARTEVAYAATTTQMEAYRYCGVEQVQFVYGGGPCTEGVCPELDGQVFPIDEAEEPPIHPNCDCVLVPFVADALTEPSS